MMPMLLIQSSPDPFTSYGRPSIPLLDRAFVYFPLKELVSRLTI